MSEYNIQMNKYNALNAGYDQLYPQPMKHANTHAEDGNDPITPSMIGTYNKTEIDTALQKKVNPNLLDNWYFGNPVNQRGVAASTANQYGIDRWLTYNGTHTVADGYVEISQNGVMSQLLENYSELNGMEMTASVLTADGTLYAGTAVIDLSSSTIFQSVIGFTSYLTKNGIFQFSPTTGPLKLVAAKLELGSQQTLAHQDANGNWVLNEIPDYGEQLRRCQRYFQKIGVSSGKYNIIGVRSDDANCGCPVVFNEMRATPVVTLPDSSACDIWYNMVSNAVSSVSYEQINNRSMWLKFASTVVTSGNSCVMRISSGNYIQLSADL